VAADAEKLLIEWLAEQTAVRAVEEVPAGYPGDVETPEPLIHVDELPGPGESVPTVDEAIVDLYFYAADRPTARALAEQCRSLVTYQLPLAVFDDGKTTIPKTHVTRPSRLPFPGAVHVYIATVRMTVHSRA
jgi:hypothetical protein